MGVTDQHGRKWEGLGRIVAAAGTPKLPREVSLPSPTLGCDLLQHEVIEVLLGDGALDTERTVTLLLPCSLQVIIFTVFFYFLFLFLPLYCHFIFPLCACPVLLITQRCSLLSFLLFSLPFSFLFFLIFHSLVSWSHGLPPQPKVVILCFGKVKCSTIFLSQAPDL